MRKAVISGCCIAALTSFGCIRGVELPAGVESNHQLVTVINLDTFRGVDDTTRTSFDIVVKDLNSEEPLEDALVWVRVEGSVIELTPRAGDPGWYELDIDGYAASYQFGMERGSDYIFIDLEVPEPASLALSPVAPVAGQETLLAWTASGQADHVGLRIDGEHVLRDSPDDGSESLPATAFPEAGVYGLRLFRSKVEFWYTDTESSTLTHRHQVGSGWVIGSVSEALVVVQD